MKRRPKADPLSRYRQLLAPFISSGEINFVFNDHSKFTQNTLIVGKGKILNRYIYEPTRMLICENRCFD